MKKFFALFIIFSIFGCVNTAEQPQTEPQTDEKIYPFERTLERTGEMIERANLSSSQLRWLMEEVEHFDAPPEFKSYVYSKIALEMGDRLRSLLRSQ